MLARDNGFMKILRNSFILGGLILAGLSMGQATKVDLVSLKNLHKEMRNAYRTIQRCMPIYEGHRGLAIGALHEAEAIVQGVILANEPSPKPVEPATAAAAKPPVLEKVKAKETPKKKEEAKAAPVPKPAPATVPVTPAAKIPEEVKAEEQKKIAESQARFRHALELIQDAIKDLKPAETSLSADQAAKVAKLLETAQEESTKSIAVHEKEG